VEGSKENEQHGGGKEKKGVTGARFSETSPFPNHRAKNCDFSAFNRKKKSKLKREEGKKGKSSKKGKKGRVAAELEEKTIYIQHIAKGT